MEISTLTQTSLIARAASNPEGDTRLALIALKQAQSQAKQEGAALVQLIKEAPSPAPTNGHIDLYV